MNTVTNERVLLDALKKLLFPLIKEAVLEALTEHDSRITKQYPEKVSVIQACELTGYSRNSLYQLHFKGRIPGALKVGGKLLFDTATLRKWVENGGR